MKYRIALLLVLFLSSMSICHGFTITGEDWLVHFNLPDASTSYNTGSPEEFRIRNALLERIDALQSGDSAILATYSFSGTSYDAGGAAGPIITAMTGALDRGAKISFVADSYVDTAYLRNNTNSLDTLAARGVNPLVLTEDDSSSGIHHNKLGVFDYGSGERWVFVTSWNMTGGASSYQWNMAIEIRDDVLHAAYTNEMRELLAGRFHDHATKSHAHNMTTFQLPGGWGDNWVMFGPYPDDDDGGTNAMSWAVKMIDNAQEEIVFAINSMTLWDTRDALVNAADRGVIIHGSFPLEEIEPGKSTYDVYTYLTNTANYATTNVVHFVTAYRKADWTALDYGGLDNADLIHAKWMTIDPWGKEPVTIHGSANWTFSAMGDTDNNDENVLFLRHGDIARTFYAHFKRITAMWNERSDHWCEIGLGEVGPEVNFWTTSTNVYELENGVDGTWAGHTLSVTDFIGRVTIPVDSFGDVRLFRGKRE